MDPKNHLTVAVDFSPDRHRDVPFADGDVSADEEDDQLAEDGVPRPSQPDPAMLSAKFKRRNSISLPAGLDALAAVPEEMAGDERSDDRSSDGNSSSDDEESFSNSEDENISIKVPLRNARKKSVMPLPKLRLNDKALPDEFEDRGLSGMDSPGNSVTSINSLSSLLKEKLVMTFPGVLRRKRPREYKLKAFVAILFLCIVFLVGFAYIFYQQQVLQRAYFERIRFNKEERHIKVFSHDGHELLSGDLGVGIGGKPYPCLARDEPGDGAICMEWTRLARLTMRSSFHDNDTRCFQVTWQALSENHHPTDCFDWSPSKGHWYGGGLAHGSAWPLEESRVMMAPFITGSLPEQTWANVLRRYFVNSKGVAILIGEESPLYLDINATVPEKLCIKAKHDDFAYVYHEHDLPVLNYSVCTSSDIKQLHEFLAENSLWDGTKDSDLQAVYSMLQEPIWEISPHNADYMSESEVANLTEEVISLGYPAGQVLLNEFWQSNVGDLVLDESRFPTFNETIDIIHRRGFRLALTVQPFISTESASFHEAVRDGLLINERGAEIPALTRYKSILSAGVLDITKNHSTMWIQQKLVSVQQQLGVDSFFLDMGSAYNLPKYYQFERKLTNPDKFKSLFAERVQQRVPLMGVSGAVQLPRPPTFVALPNLPSDWRSLSRIISSALTYGLMGYPFLLSGSIGGDCVIASSLPEKQLYIRWLQLATFMPTMLFKHLPSRYDADVEKIGKAMLEIRQTVVNPLLKKAVEDALDHGLPIMRPLWMLEPLDQAAQTVNDEFAVSDQLIVAPVLQQDAKEREIYLPSGVWRDGIDGSMRKGNRWIHHYPVPLDKVAYFVRMPNNIRF